MPNCVMQIMFFKMNLTLSFWKGHVLYSTAHFTFKQKITTKAFKVYSLCLVLHMIYSIGSIE